MRTYHVVFSVCVFFSIAACTSKPGVRRGADSGKDTLVYRINFEESFDTGRELKLTEIANSIEYLQLKTPKGIFISSIRNVQITADYILLTSRGIVYQFRRDGSFVRQIGAKGKGPGEYSNANSIDIDEKTGEILVFEYFNILHYQPDGSFIRSHNVHSALAKVDSVIWTGTSSPNAFTKYLAAAVNFKGDTLCTIYNPIRVPVKIGSGGLMSSFMVTSKYQKSLYASNNKLFFKGGEDNDTIWELKLPRPEIHAIVNIGKYKLPVEYQADYSASDFKKHAPDYFGIPRVFEDDHYFYLMAQPRLSVSGEFIYFPMVFDKKLQSGYVVKKDTVLGITDDILNGPSFWPFFISNEYYIGAAEAYELMETLAGTKSDYFKKLLSTINEDSNQILILCKRKY